MGLDLKMPGEKFAIGDLARRTGCSKDTIRYYERIGLMPEVNRTAGGHRLYNGDHVRTLAFIRQSRRLGFGLDQVRQILAAAEQGSYSCEKMRALLAECVAGISRQIEDLQTAERNLRKMINDCGDTELANCRVIESMLAGEDAALGAGSCCSGPSAWPKRA